MEEDGFVDSMWSYETLEQRYVLAVLYFSTDGNFWSNKGNWLTASPECSWFGIVCEDGINVNNLYFGEYDGTWITTMYPPR